MTSDAALAPVLVHVMAAIAPLLLACGASDPTPMPETAPCPSSTFRDPNRYAALTLAPTVDGLTFFTPGAEGWESSGSLGTPCSGAADKDACAKRIDAFAVDAKDRQIGWTRGEFSPEFAVVTQGENVRRIALIEDLRPVVAPIEGLAEAATWAFLNGLSVACDGPNARTQSDGIVLQQVSGNCGHPVVETLMLVRPDGTHSILAENDLGGEDSNCAEGRRPSGYATGHGPGSRPQAHLAEIAHMEAAAVVAFAELERNLAFFSAPEELRARVARARRDEIAHAAIMGAQARRLGARPPAVVHALGQHQRPLLAIAIDNIVEGCVRETYGAVVATWQSLHAEDPELRAAFRSLRRTRPSTQRSRWISRRGSKQSSRATNERSWRKRSRLP